MLAAWLVVFCGVIARPYIAESRVRRYHARQLERLVGRIHDVADAATRNLVQASLVAAIQGGAA